MTSERNYTLLDRLCLAIDQGLRALTNNVKTTGEAYPAEDLSLQDISDQQAQISARLMRINHAGEICAQALYHGQGFVSQSSTIQAKMQIAALEEGNHLRWCKKRLDELDDHTSYLNPLWYAGSFCIGMFAGLMGDQWSMGFLAETEQQVVNHIENHLAQLKINDPRSYKILQKMQEDEARHRDDAIELGAKELPSIIQQGMRFTSKIMVKTAYWF